MPQPPLDLEALLGGDVLVAARTLLGHHVVHGGVTLRLTEVEAYAGQDDPGSHAYRGRTPRTEVMFGPAGRLYVYFSYGMHWCANVVTGPEGRASAVLLRAGEVVGGHDVAAARRPGARGRDWARGPARLTATLGIAARRERARPARPSDRRSARATPVGGPPGAGPNRREGRGQRAGWRRRGLPVAVLARRRADRQCVPPGGVEAAYSRISASSRLLTSSGAKPARTAARARSATP